jgi:nucleotide-binding universal stress UspA family protein
LFHWTALSSQNGPCRRRWSWRYYSQYGTYVALEAAAYTEAIESAEAVIARYLVEVQRHLTNRGLTVTVEYRRGDPAHEIVAITRPGDLVVMATHGRSGLGRVFLGSVAEAVVRHARVPVLLVRADIKQPVDPVVDRLVTSVGSDQRTLASEPW